MSGTPADSSTGARIPWHLDRGRGAGEMGYLPGLDGLRALAVLGVLLYHADVTWIPGGFLGVDVFFVLSGFLITSLILEGLDRTGRVNFGRFYAGRARRLLPALLLVLLVTCIAAVLVYRDAVPQLRADALASLLYVNNWWYVVQHQSYFAFIGRPPMLKHLWSLAVEEQFYLIWPAVAFLLWKRGGRRLILIVAIALALASSAWMILLSVRHGYPLLEDPSRAYFGADSHCMGLLVGAALATVWRPGRLPARVSPTATFGLLITGLAALAGVIAYFVLVGEFSPFLYTQGGFLVLALVVALLIAMATHPASPLGPIMGTQPWRWIGQRSYGIYLWHWPVFMVTRPMLDIPLDGPLLLALRLALTAVIAELSYRFVELPIRRGALARAWTRLRSAAPAVRRRLTAALAAGVAIAAAALIALVIALAAVPEASAEVPADVAAAMGIADGGPTEVTIDDGPSGAAPTPSGTSSTSRATASPSASPSRSNGPVTLFGDSVMLGARSAIYDAIPGAKVDAAVSRFPGAFVGRIRKLAARNRLADVVVVHAGTNGILPESILRGILDPLRDRQRVVLVTTAVPRPWRAPDNATIASVAKDYPNVVIADWNARSKDHPEWFVSDGVHLTPAGARAYAALIAKATGLSLP